ncbi:MAG TPA: hypothetical protein VGB37_00185, partial [Candidatus Lokiarchaeia archaeon]
MSLEKRKETKEEEKKRILEESTFRRDSFAPLEQISESKKEKSVSKVIVKEKLITDELTQLEQEVLEIAKEILKLKRYDTDFEIDSEQEIQKYPIIEKLYAKCIAKLSYKEGYSKNDIFLAIRSLDEKSWIVTNDRRTKIEILENEKLMSILNFVKQNPGIHARDERINDLGI